MPDGLADRRAGARAVASLGCRPRSAPRRRVHCRGRHQDRAVRVGHPVRGRAASPRCSRTTSTRPSCTSPTPSPPARALRRRRGARAGRGGPRPGARAHRHGRALRPSPATALAFDPRGWPLGRARSSMPAATRPVPRSSARSSPRSRPRRPRSASAGSPLDLLVEGGRAVGVMRPRPDGARAEIRARHTVVATGGAGQCFAVTTNPSLSTGDGIAMALRAGVAVADVEFMQFHPTALHHPSMPRPLLSEALRGEGAMLRDEHGRRVHGRRASARPISRPATSSRGAIARRLDERGLDHLWLDATPIDGFAARFPTVWRGVPGRRASTRARLAPGRAGRALPVGGICTDLDGATTLPRPVGVRRGRLLAASTAPTASRRTRCSTGSSSARGASTPSRAGKDAPERTGVMRGHRAAARARRRPARAGRRRAGATTREELQQLMTREAGVLRDARRLDAPLDALEAMAPRTPRSRNLSGEHARSCGARWHARSRAARTRVSTSPSRSPDVPRPVRVRRRRRPRRSCRCRREVPASTTGERLGRARPPRRATPWRVARIAEDLGPLGDLTAALVDPGTRRRRRRRRAPCQRRARGDALRDRGVRAGRSRDRGALGVRRRRRGRPRRR